MHHRLKSVADILNGNACVQDDEVKPLFPRMSTRTLSLVEDFDLRPPKDCDDPVEQRPQKRPDMQLAARRSGGRPHDR